MITKYLVILCCISLAIAANSKCSQAERSKQFCTMEYAPVCGISMDGSDQVRTTHSNRCSACGDKGIEFIIEGECETYPENAYFCHPDSHLNEMCTKEFRQVCGYFDRSIQCIRAPCAATFSNQCMGCQVEQVSYTISGKCD